MTSDTEPQDESDQRRRVIRVGETTDGPGSGDVPSGQPVDLPVEEILTGRAFVTGKSGSGKSNTGGVVCEQLLAAGHPLFIVDIEGEHYSLKQEYEVLHIGADDDCDLQVGPEHADRIADLALKQNVPVILDLSGFLDDDKQDEIVGAFAQQLFYKQKKIRRPFLLLIEEVHEFIPESGSIGETGKKLIRIAKRGRKRGLGIAGFSQRPADVKKDFITQCDWMVWHRLTWNNDTDVVRRVLGSTYGNAVEDLADGEGFLYADFLEPDIRRVQMDRKQTFDAGATPGLDDIDRPELKSIDDDLAEELDDITEETEKRQDELKQAKQRIDELEAELDDKEERIDRLRDLRQMVESVDGLETGQAQPTTIKLDGDEITVPEKLQAEVLEIRQEKESIRQEKDSLAEELETVKAERDRFQAELEERPSVEAYESLAGDLTELVHRHQDLIETEATRTVSELEERITELEERNQQLEEQVKDQPDKIAEVLAHPAVESRIDSLAEESSLADSHVWDVILALSDADSEWLEVAEIAPYCKVSSSSVNTILSEIAEHGIVERDTESRPYKHRLKTETLQALIGKEHMTEKIDRQRETSD